MSILQKLMAKRGFKLINTERTECYMRKTTYESFTKDNKKKKVTIIIDERDLQGVSDIDHLEYYYNSKIKSALA